MGSHQNVSSKEVIIYIYIYLLNLVEIIIISMKKDGQQYVKKGQLGEVKHNNC